MIYCKDGHYYMSIQRTLVEVKPVLTDEYLTFEPLNNTIEYYTDHVPKEYTVKTSNELYKELSNKKTEKIEEDTKFNGIFGEKSTKNKKTI